jgi:hypothetical protein
MQKKTGSEVSSNAADVNRLKKPKKMVLKPFK